MGINNIRVKIRKVGCSNKNVEKKEKIYSFLTGTRGVASVLVLVHHFYLAFYPAFPLENGNMSFIHHSLNEKLYYESPFLFIVNGRFRVLIFFVLSGYVLSKREFSKDNILDLTSASIRRFTRLFIPVAFSLVVAILLNKIAFNFSVEAAKITKSSFILTLNSSSSLFSFFKELLFSAMFEGHSSLNPVLWTMSIELYGSFLVFSLIALTRNIKKRSLVWFSVFLLLILRHEVDYSAFILGMLLNYLDDIKFEDGFWKTSLIFLGVACSLMLGGYTANSSGTIYESLPNMFKNYAVLVNLIGAFILILLIQHSNTIKKFLSFRFFTFLGNTSFSVYLIHILVLSSFSSFLLIKVSGILTYNVAVFVISILSFLLIYILGYLMTLFIDKKAIIASNLVYTKLFKSSN